MQAEKCYQLKAKEAIPIHLLDKKQYADKKKLSSYERHYLDAHGFEAELGQAVLICDSAGAANVAYIGQGDNNTDATAIAYAVNSLPAATYCLPKTISHLARVIWSLAQYRFDRYKVNILPLRVLQVDIEEYPSILAEASAVFLVRDLINTPTNDLGPAALAKIVEGIAQQYGAKFQQWVGQELLDANFPAIYAVGRAASQAPRLISLEWGNPKHPRISLVGKGVCFDSGGLDLKPASGMRLMKKDMGGAAQVIALAEWLMKEKLPIYLQVLIPAVENAVDAEAYRPGDILRMRNGLTVEIHNTDAEGRLILADALVKACEDKPELIIDFATLTGAARVAVGPDLAALFSNDDTLAAQLEASGLLSDDPLWRLPLFEPYTALFESKVADMMNASESPYAGGITAALFLQRFIAPHISWAHFDIMAWNAGNIPGKPEGGEAMALRAVASYLRKKFSS